MIVFTILLNLLFFYSLLARVLRWSSLWQQKEYRLDRLGAFLSSPEGRRELLNVVNLPISKKKLKRPKLTLKAIAIIGFTFYLIASTPISTMIDLAFLYVFSPLYVLVATLPFWVITQVVTWFYLYQAQEKVQQVNPKIIGVSGSYGKTTTKILIGHLLGKKKKVWVSPKSHNTPLSISKAIAQSFSKQKLMIIEYASYRIGEIEYLAKKFPPHMAVFTGINDQHLAIFGGRENMEQAETELFPLLPAKAPLFFNDHDTTVSKLVKKFTQVKPIPASTTVFSKVAIDDQGRLLLRLKGSRKTYSLKLIGDHYLANIQQAINVAAHFKIKPTESLEYLAEFEPTEEFVRSRHTSSGGLIIIDDRTSNPDGFKQIIELAGRLPFKQKVLIASGIVDLGDAEDNIHTSLAKQMKKSLDLFIHTDQTAKVPLSTVLGKKYVFIEDENELSKLLGSFNSAQSLITIEGKIKSSLQQIVYKL